MTLQNNRAPVLCYVKLCALLQSHQWIQTGVTIWKCSIGVKICNFFVPLWPWNLKMALKIYRAPLLYFFKLCVSFHSHCWIQTGGIVQKWPIWVKICNFLSRVTLKFDGWPSNTIGHLFYATSSFVHHFIAIGDFKLELQSGNAQFGSKSAMFLSRVTLKFDRWP